MAKRTYSHRQAARRISENLRRDKERENKVREELIEYLDGKTNSLEELVNDLSYTSNVINLRYDDYYLIRINREGFSIFPKNDKSIKISQRLNYLILNLPPVPKSFENFYAVYIKLEKESDKIKLANSYFKQIPEKVHYFIPIQGYSIEFWKEGKEIFYRKSNRRFYKWKKLDKKEVDEILKYAKAVNAHSR